MQLLIFLLLSFCGLLVFAAGLMAKDVPLEPTKPDQRKRRKILTKLERWFSMRVECIYCGCHKSGNPFSNNVSHGACKPCQQDQLLKLSMRTDANTAVQ